MNIFSENVDFKNVSCLPFRLLVSTVTVVDEGAEDYRVQMQADCCDCIVRGVPI